MNTMPVRRALVSGTYAGLCMSVAMGLIGKTVLGKTAVPLNAISHIVWGPKAACEMDWSLRHTGSGLILNQVACLFWAICYEAMTDPRLPPRWSTAIAVSALAYITDYHLVPRRFTPGFEHLFSRHMFPWLYAALAASLVTGACIQRAETNGNATVP